jgi:N-acetylglucosamine kinase-like BadF-type ATPase
MCASLQGLGLLSVPEKMGKSSRVGDADTFLLTYLSQPDLISNSALRSIQEVFGSTEETTIVTGVYKAPSPATILARLVKALGHDAAEGRPYAVASVQHNTTELANLFVRHVTEHHPSATRLSVSLSGGVWKAAAIFKDTFRDVIVRSLPDVEFDIRRLTKPPLYGAVELAKEMNHGN